MQHTAHTGKRCRSRILLGSFRSNAGALGVALALAAFPGLSAAQGLTPTSQDRRVAATIDIASFSGGPVHMEESESAPDFGPFSATVDGWTQPPPPDPPLAWQNSSIQPNALHAWGSALGTPGAAPVGTSVSEHTASIFVVTFDVAEDAPFTLGGTLDLDLGYCDSDVGGSIRLSGPSGVIAEVADFFEQDECWGEPCQASLPISAGGVLGPGSYTLEARVDANAKEILYPDKICIPPDPLGVYEVHLQLVTPGVPVLPAPLAGAVVLGVVGLAAGRALHVRLSASSSRSASRAATPR